MSLELASSFTLLFHTTFRNMMEQVETCGVIFAPVSDWQSVGLLGTSCVVLV